MTATFALSEEQGGPRRFFLLRHQDVSGISGTGIVAEGILFADLTAAVHWRGQWPSTTVWPSLDAMMAVHGHGGLTEILFVDKDALLEHCIA